MNEWKFKDLTFTLCEKGELRVTGSGNIDFEGAFAPWFNRSKNIKQITIYSDSDIIANNVFENCINLEKVILTNADIKIRENAFVGCYNLNWINKDLGDSELIYEDSYISFKLLPGNIGVISSINKPTEFNESNTDFSKLNFERGIKTLYIDIENTTKKIISNKEKVTFLLLRDLLVNIESSNNIETLILNKSIPDNYIYSLNFKKNIKSIYLSSKIKKIEFASFRNFGIKTMYITPSIKDIECDSFYNCKNLKTIEFSSDINLNGFSFASCKNLSKIKGSEHIKNIETSVFYGCESLKEFSFNKKIKTIKSNAFEKSGLQKLDISKTNIKKIEEYAFGSCLNLEKVLLPEHEISIDKSSFLNTPKLNNKKPL